MGIMTLSANLRRRGHDVGLLVAERWGEEPLAAEVERRAPDVLAFSAMTGEHNDLLALAVRLKRRRPCFCVFGGPHPTFAPEMIEKPGVDAVCRGEGDESFPALLERLSAGKDPYDLPGFWFRTPTGEIVRNAMAPLVENLDALPWPDREIMYEADPSLRAKGTRSFVAMRGCPYRCSYCFNHVYNDLTAGTGTLLRHRSVADVVGEMREVRSRYGLDHAYIVDDTFLLKPPGWLEAFADLYPGEVGAPLVLNVRANLIDGDRTAALLARMRCRYVYMGVECGDPRISADVLERGISNERIESACRALQARGIRVMTQSIVGLPVDRPLEVDLVTLDFNIRLRPYFAMSSLYYPYPGTRLGEIAVRRGMFRPDFDRIHVSNKTRSALDFGDEALRRRIVHLHKLFGLVVQFPILRRLLDRLLDRPWSELYTYLFFAFYGWKVPKNTGLTGCLRTLRHYVPFYFRYVAGLERRRGQ